jgi:hypothetical protein
MAEIKTDELSVGALSQVDFSDSSSDVDFSDDGLSAISDVSSVASFHIPPPKKKGKIPQKRPSRIPVPKFRPSAPKRSPSDGFRLARPTDSIPPPPPPIRPTNFLAPDLSDYSNITICIFEGTDFPRSRFGERSTYVAVHLHPQLPVIKSPICFNRTNNAVYNGGFSLNCIGIDFSTVVPVIEVFDFISEGQSELIGLGYLQYHLAKRVDDVCIVLQDEWVNIVTVNTRIHCGKVKMSLLFHDQERDVAELIRTGSSENSEGQPEIQRPIQNGGSRKIVTEEKPAVMKESLAVQAELEPCYQKVDSAIGDIGAIGELNLTFNSPLRPIAKPVKVPTRKAICFVDESDLDQNDEIITKCQVMRPITPVSKVESPEQNEEVSRRVLPRLPLRQVNPSLNEGTQETPLKARFASYSKYSWA